MNHYLRFARVSDCAHANALRHGVGFVIATVWLSSCATHEQVSKDVPEASLQKVALKNAQLRYESYVFTAPDDFYPHEENEAPKIARILNEEEGQALLRKIRMKRGFSLETMPSVVCRQGQKGDVQLIRDMSYPTEYDPPKLSDLFSEGETLSVTPAMPTKFDTRKVGSIFSFLGKTSNKGVHQVNCDVSKTSFLGFVNYGKPITAKIKGAFGREKEVVVAENEILMPLFDRQRLASDISIPDGSYVLMSGFKPQALARNKMHADKFFGVQEEDLKNTLVLIRVAAER